MNGFACAAVFQQGIIFTKERAQMTKIAKILLAREMSFTSMATQAVLVNASTMGKNDWVAKAGASSVLVYIILGID